MIEFRFPFILYIYFPLFIVFIFWIVNNRKKTALAEISTELRSRLLMNTDVKKNQNKRPVSISIFNLFNFCSIRTANWYSFSAS